MAYITSNNKIMMLSDYHLESIKINNSTNHLPLCVRGNIVLLSDNKLYTCNDWMCFNGLLPITMSDNSDYIVDSNNFTDKFVKINSGYYRIDDVTLRKINEKIKNLVNIVTYTYQNTNDFYYINKNSKLLLSGDKFGKVYFDNNVDLIIYCSTITERRSTRYCLVYSKNNKIIFSVYENNGLLITTSVLNYCGSEIVKASDKYILDSNHSVYKINVQPSYYCTIKKLYDAKDFNFYSNSLILLRNDGEIYAPDYYNYSDNLVCIDGRKDNFFQQRICKVKSAAKII